MEANLKKHTSSGYDEVLAKLPDALQRAVVLAVDPTQTVAARDPRLAGVATRVRSNLARALEQLG